MFQNAPFSIPRTRRIAVACVALVTGLALVFIATVANRGATAATEFDAPRERPMRELPLEWRWEKPGVEYRHMYRPNGKSRPPLFYIREGGR